MDARTQRIREEVFRRTGKSIDPDDPFIVAAEMLIVVSEDLEKKHNAVLKSLRDENSAIREITPKIERLIEALSKLSKNVEAEERLEALIKNYYQKQIRLQEWIVIANAKLKRFVPSNFVYMCVALAGFTGGLMSALIIWLVKG